MRIEPFGLGQLARRRADSPQRRRLSPTMEVRFRKSETPRPEENRAPPLVGRTWLGPAT